MRPLVAAVRPAPAAQGRHVRRRPPRAQLRAERRQVRAERRQATRALAAAHERPAGWERLPATPRPGRPLTLAETTATATPAAAAALAALAALATEPDDGGNDAP